MKKKYFVLFATLMACTFAACGGEKEPEQKEPAQVEEETTETTETAEPTEAAESEEPEVTATPEVVEEEKVEVVLQSYPKEGETTAMKALIYYPKDSGIKDSNYPEDKEFKNLEENYRINIKSYQDDEYETLRMKYQTFMQNYTETEFLGYEAFVAENFDYYSIAVLFEQEDTISRYIEIIVCSIGETDMSAKEIYDAYPVIQEVIETIEYVGVVEATRD